MFSKLFVFFRHFAGMLVFLRGHSRVLVGVTVIGLFSIYCPSKCLRPNVEKVFFAMALLWIQHLMLGT